MDEYPAESLLASFPAVRLDTYSRVRADGGIRRASLIPVGY